MLAHTSWPATIPFVTSRPRCAGNRSAWLAKAAPSRGVISVKLTTFALPISVSSKRSGRTGALLGGSVSAVTSPMRK